MSKYKDSKWSRIREYVSFEIAGDAANQFVVGVCPDGREMFPNICYFDPDDNPDEKLPYFYVNRKVLKNDASAEYERSLTSLDLFSKSHDPPFYIRSLLNDKIFLMDALILFPIALEKQEYPVDEVFLRSLREVIIAAEPIYKTIPEKEFWNMLNNLDIDKSNIVIVPDVQQLYRYAHSEWELPDIVFAPDGQIVFGSQHAVFYVFQLLFCWKRDECSSCSHENFEKEVHHVMSVFAEFDDSIFLPQKFFVFTFAKLLSKLCTECMRKYPKSTSVPLPDKRSTDRVSIADLEASIEKYGVPVEADYGKLCTLIGALYCSVWMLRLFMVGGWFRKVLSKMEETVKQSLLTTVEYLMPQYLRKCEQKEEFLKFVMLGSAEDRFTRSKEKAKNRAETLKMRKAKRKEEKGEKMVLKSENESESDYEDDPFMDLAVKLLVKETAEEGHHRDNITEGVWKKPSRKEESEDIGTDGYIEGEELSTAVAMMEKDICRNEMPKPPETNVIRHTRYAEIQEMVLTHTTGDMWCFFVGKLEDGTLIYPNLEYFTHKGRVLVKDFFYYSWTENKDKIKNDRTSIMRMSNLEKFAKAYNPTLYIRCLMDNVVFLEDLLKILRIAYEDDQITDSFLLTLLGNEDMQLSSTEFYPTIHVDFVLKMIDVLDIDPSRIVIVPDILQQRAFEKCELPFETPAPDTKNVMSFEQAVFATFQEAFCWKGAECKKNCQAIMEKIIVLYMDSYLKMEPTFYKSTEQILLNIDGTYKKFLCKNCFDLKSKASHDPFAARKHNDTIFFSDLPKLKTEFGVPKILEPHIQERIKNQESIFVWKAKLIMFLEWISKAFSSLNEPIVDTLHKVMKLLVPCEIWTDPNQSDPFVHKVLSGWKALPNIEVVAKAIEAEKSIKHDATCDQQKVQKQNIVENNMDALLKTIAKLEGKPAKMLEVARQCLSPLENSAPEVLPNERKFEKQGPELEYKSTKINRLEEVISFQEEESGKLVSAMYAENVKLCANVRAFSTNVRVTEYFYMNRYLEWARRLTFSEYARLEEFAKIMSDPFYIRTMGGWKDNAKMIFADEVRRVIPIALNKQGCNPGKALLAKLKNLWKSENDHIYLTISVDEFLETLEQFDVDKRNIMLVPDCGQVYSLNVNDWILPLNTFAPDTTPVFAPLQAAFTLFERLVFWRKVVCREKCRCRDGFEEAVLDVLEGYADMDQTHFISVAYCCSNQLVKLFTLLCRKCIKLFPNSFVKPLPNHNSTDNVSNPKALIAYQEFLGDQEKQMNKFIVQRGPWLVCHLRFFIFGRLLHSSFVSKNQKVVEFLQNASWYLMPMELRDDKKILEFLTEVYKSGNIPKESEKMNNCAASNKESSKKQKKEPAVPEAAPVEDPREPVSQTKKKWIVPKRKRPDPPYKPNRVRRKDSKKAPRSEDTSPAKMLRQDASSSSGPAPGLASGPTLGPASRPASGPTPRAAPEPALGPAPGPALEPAPEPAPGSSLGPAPEPNLEPAPGPAPGSSPESAPEPTNPPEQDTKTNQIANVRKELQEAKLELSTLRAQNQRNEGLELKVKKLQEEKRLMKEAHDLERRGLEKQHSVLVKHLTENIGNLKTKLADQANTANEKIQKLSNPKTREKVIQDQKDKEIEELRRALSKQTREASNLRNQLSQKDTKQAQMEDENLQLKNTVQELQTQLAQKTTENLENQKATEQLVALRTRNQTAEDRIHSLVEELAGALQLNI